MQMLHHHTDRGCCLFYCNVHRVHSILASQHANISKFVVSVLMLSAVSLETFKVDQI